MIKIVIIKIIENKIIGQILEFWLRSTGFKVFLNPLVDIFSYLHQEYSLKMCISAVKLTFSALEGIILSAIPKRKVSQPEIWNYVLFWLNLSYHGWAIFYNAVTTLNMLVSNSFRNNLSPKGWSPKLKIQIRWIAKYLWSLLFTN